jgi:hypothetical protein
MWTRPSRTACASGSRTRERRVAVDAATSVLASRTQLRFSSARKHPRSRLRTARTSRPSQGAAPRRWLMARSHCPILGTSQHPRPTARSRREHSPRQLSSRLPRPRTARAPRGSRNACAIRRRRRRSRGRRLPLDSAKGRADAGGAPSSTASPSRPLHAGTQGRSPRHPCRSTSIDRYKPHMQTLARHMQTLAHLRCARDLRSWHRAIRSPAGGEEPRHA